MSQAESFIGKIKLKKEEVQMAGISMSVLLSFTSLVISFKALDLLLQDTSLSFL